MLAVATRIAQLLTSRSKLVGKATVRDQTLMGSLSIAVAARNLDHEALNPLFQEILLFGSVAEGKENPSDVDLMVFDHGFYSNVLTPSSSRKMNAHYGKLSNNLHTLLYGWFGLDEASEEVLEISECAVDLLALPIDIFTDKHMLECMARNQPDPDFFPNAFSNMMRFNPTTESFEKVDLSYFEQKYGGNLSHLRKVVEAA